MEYIEMREDGTTGWHIRSTTDRDINWMWLESDDDDDETLVALAAQCVLGLDLPVALVDEKDEFVEWVFAPKERQEDDGPRGLADDATEAEKTEYWEGE